MQRSSLFISIFIERGLLYKIMNIITDILDGIIANAENPQNEYHKTGLPCIDRTFGGGLPQGLHVFAGAPGTGKTTLAVQIAHNVAKQGGEALIYELEMSPAYIVARGISLEAYIDDPASLYNPFVTRLAMPNKANPLDPRTIERVRIGAANYREYAGRVCIETETPFVEDIWQGVEACIGRHGTRPLVLIDHLRCLRTKAATMDTYEQERNVVTALKGMADQCGIAVILVATLNKGGIKSAKGMDAVRGSTDIPFAADTLSLLTSDNKGIVAFQTVKNRSGACGTSTLRFRGEFGVFEDLEADTVQAAWPEHQKKKYASMSEMIADPAFIAELEGE